MLTALQELKLAFQPNGVYSCSEIYEAINEAIVKEREQIENAFYEGFRPSLDYDYNPETYYTKTYNNESI